MSQHLTGLPTPTEIPKIRSPGRVRAISSKRCSATLGGNRSSLFGMDALLSC